MIGPPAAPPLRQPDTPSRPPRGVLIFAVTLTVVWCAILIGMAYLTADPVTLNRDQILRADFVITGKVDSDPAIGEVTVAREWKKDGLTGRIHVENLEDARAHRGATYLLPLSHASTGYRVTDARMANAPALIYPATGVATNQLEAILSDRSAKH